MAVKLPDLRGTRRRAFQLIETAPGVTIVFAGEFHHSAAKSWLAKFPSRKLTYTDAVSFALMRERRCDHFLSFDTDLLAAGFHP